MKKPTVAKGQASNKGSTRKKAPASAQSNANGAFAQIYALFDPRGGGIRYIGKAKSAERRFKGHLREVRRVTPLYQWISKLRSEGVMPAMAVIANAISDDWQDLERTLISQWRLDGMRLLNVAEGGDEPYCAPEIRAANGRRLVERMASDPLLARIARNKRMLGTALRRGTVNEATKEKMRLAAAKAPHLFGEWANV